MQIYNLDILGISECRWSGSGRLKTQTGEAILYSGRDDNIHQSGVALVMNKQAAGCVGKTAQVVKEMQIYNLDILGISECRSSGSGQLKTQTDEAILYSGRDDNIHQSGVALVMNKQAAGCLGSWMPVSDRIMSARFTSRFIKTTVVQVYAMRQMKRQRIAFTICYRG